MLVGVWHGVYNGAPDEVTVTGEELQSFLDETNEAYPDLSLSLEDVTLVNTGLILYAENKQGSHEISFGKRSILIDHDKRHKVKGLITLIGVRATTARGMAEKAVNLIFKKLGRRPPKSETETTPVFGGRIGIFNDFTGRVMEQQPYGLDQGVLHALIQNYGCEYPGVLKYVEEHPDLGDRVANSAVLKAEVIHAVREEMAEKLGDVVFRRTDMGTGGYPGEKALETCAGLMAAELGWDVDRTRVEISEVRGEFLRHRSIANPGSNGKANRAAL